MTAAGSLAVRPGHLGASADVDGDWPDDGPPMSAAEASIWNDIIEYVQEHAGESGLSFRRINEGAKGNQALKRQALDQMRRDCLVTETDGPNRSKIYRPGPLLEWIGKAIAG